MAWVNVTFGSGTAMTSTKQSQQQADFAALAAGDTGAPLIQPLAIDSSKDYSMNKLTLGQEIVLPTTTRYYSINPINFALLDKYGSPDCSINSNGYATLSEDGDNTFDAVINLPNGAIITSIHFVIRGSGSVFTQYLWRSDRSGTIVNMYNSGNKSPLPFVYVEWEGTNINYNTIDNMNYNYYLGIRINGYATAIYAGGYISYTIEEPLP